MIALVLLFHITKSIECAALVEFVECNHIRKVKHVNFLELGSGPILGRHYIQRHITVIDDLRITLANARCF